jgi:predicted DNA-binding transcriptional regulator YafY
MPLNKYALLRYRIIHRCLSNRYLPYPSKDFLREKCEEALYGSTDGSKLSVKTIERDLRDMREDDLLGYHAPILYCKIHHGYYYGDPEFDLDHKPLSPEEADALAFAANTLFQFKDTGMFQPYAFAIEKIFEQLQFRQDEDKDLPALVQFETAPYFKGSHFLQPVYRALRQQAPIRFWYHKFQDEHATLRTLDPYLLKEYRNRWYVIGIEHEKQRYQSFGLDRMSDVRVLDETYHRRGDFNPETYFRYAIGITEAGLLPEVVILSCSPQLGNYLKTQPLHHSQRTLVDNEEEYRISMEVLVTYELIQIILGYGADVMVISPSHLKKSVVESTTKALKRYRS